MIFQNIPMDNSAELARALTAAEEARVQLANTAAELEQSEQERGRLAAELDQTRGQLLELRTASGKLSSSTAAEAEP